VQGFKNDPDSGPVSASFSITYQGVGLLYVVYALAGHDDIGRSTSTDKRRTVQRMAMLGSVIPLTAMFAAIYNIYDLGFPLSLYSALLTIALPGLTYVIAACVDRNRENYMAKAILDGLEKGIVQLIF
jgi:archaellum biogenesis protein FlaJ (TadC family)